MSLTDHGPVYNIDSEPLRRHRSRSQHGLHWLTKEERRAYGAAVEAAVLSRQRAQLRAAVEPDRKSQCASGTWLNTGEGDPQRGACTSTRRVARLSICHPEGTNA